MARVYTEADRQHFAAYVDARACLRPIECTGDGMCWVDYGPPAITRQKIAPDGRRVSGGIYCVGCGGTPEIAPSQMNRGRPYGR